MNLLNNYRIIDQICLDNRYTIYQALNLIDQGLVWIKSKTINQKIADFKSRNWLKNEARILQKVNFSGLLNYCDIVKHSNNLFLITESFSGLFLNNFWQQQKITTQDFLKIAISLVDILQILHQNQIIHKNINPSNILIDPETFELKLTNFSIAANFNQKLKILPNDLEAADLAYISPEQTGKINNYTLNYRTDFYSLGIVFYKMLTRKLPYNTQEILELVHCHLAKNPVPPHQINSEVARTVSDIVMKLLAKNPDDRYQSAYGIKHDLETCLIQYQNNKKIELFEIGALDKRSNFVISNKLYGRISAINTLNSAFNRVNSGATELILLSGTSGIGKTSLIQEFTQSLVKQNVFLIVGQFEKLKINIPYVGIKKAFRSLIQQILTQNADLLQIWREKILSVVGNQGKVITDILPELELIIGSQPKVVKLPAKEAENRFNILFIEFVKLFCTKQYSLVFCLDDLHWADSASLNLLALLLDTFNQQNLLMIWSYRDDEIRKTSSAKMTLFSDFVNFTDLVSHTIDRIETKLNIHKIFLQFLNLYDINQLLIDTLKCQEIESLCLAELLLERTEGNPFFLHQLLQALYDENLFTFNFHYFSWQWNIEQICSTLISNCNLLELVTKNFEKLPSKTQKVLQTAACIGNQFHLETLAIANSLSEEEIAEDLALACTKGIISLVSGQDNSVYQFLHHRLNCLIYDSLNETEKAELHLKIGKFWFLCSTPENIKDNIFNIVNQLNLGRKLAESCLKTRIAELNLIAGKKAKQEIAYEVAGNYLDIALDLLPSSTWQENYDLMLNVYLEALEIQYLQTNFDLADNLAETIFHYSQSILEKVKVYKIKIRANIARNQMELAIKNGLSALELLEIFIPTLQKENQDFSAWLIEQSDRFRNIQHFPLIRDPRVISITEILVIIIPPLYIIQSPLFSGVIYIALQLSLEYGNCQFSAFIYALYGLLLCATGNIESGYQLGLLSLKIQEQLGTRELISKVNFIFNNTIRHWKEPVNYTLNYFLEGIQQGIEVGDIEHACFHAKYYCACLFFIGESLSVVIYKSQCQIEMIRNFKQDFQLKYAQLWRQLSLNLQGVTENQLVLIGESFDESSVIPLWEKANNGTGLFAFYLAKLILCYLLKDHQQAIFCAKKGKQYLTAAAGTICFPLYHFYTALAMLAVYSLQESFSNDFQSEYLIEIITYQKQLKIWANHAPKNYLNKYQLVTAEIARVLVNNEQAAENYDLAIASSAEAGYIQEAALAEELTGEFYLAQGKTKIAGYYLTDAYYNYLRWGALAKVKALESQHSQLLRLTSTPELTVNNNDEESIKTHQETLNQLDFFSVIKASQTIASEIILENLLSKMITIVMENTGAQKALLLLKQDSVWEVAASATINPELQIILPNLLITEYPDLPHSIINYVQSTLQTVILKEDNNENLFANDLYLLEHKPQSALAYPMTYKKQLQGIIYLENNLVKGIFTKQKLEVLQVLLSQVSISIENARLYRDLATHTSVQKSLKQKETLLKEIHHRVKNNLLVVSSLLEFQSSYLDDPKVIKLLENCQNRITSMALVHQHLYGTSELNTINFAEYTQSLLDNLAYAQACEEKNINLICDLEEIELNIETANPCGLLINELVSNAIEHGFSNRDRGNIWISLRHHSTNEVMLMVQDDGVGFKENLDLSNSNSLGLKLVNSLVKQLEGTMKLDKSQGTKITIIFEKLDYPSRI